jgi:hypothetical protein
MIEIEFSALSRQCLHRRIPTLKKLEQKIKIDWQFSIESARSKLSSHYVAIQPANEKLVVSL